MYLTRYSYKYSVIKIYFHGIRYSAYTYSCTAFSHYVYLYSIFSAGASLALFFSQSSSQSRLPFNSSLF